MERSSRSSPTTSTPTPSTRPRVRPARRRSRGGGRIAPAEVVEERGCGPVEGGEDLVAVEAVFVMEDNPGAAGAEVAQDRFGAPCIVGREVARHLGGGAGDRPAA